MGFDTQEGFIQVNKDSNVENGISVQMMELDSIIEKKTVEKVRSRQG
jgi:hypothetical protein